MKRGIVFKRSKVEELVHLVQRVATHLDALRLAEDDGPSGHRRLIQVIGNPTFGRQQGASG